MRLRYISTSLCVVAVVACSACQNDVQPIEVNAPLRNIDTQTLTAYKANLDQRSIVMAMHYGWGTVSGYDLSNTPDSLDVIVLKEHVSEFTDAMLADLESVQKSKGTKVILSEDINDLELAANNALKKDQKAAKKELLQAWKATPDTAPATDEEKEQQIEEKMQTLADAAKADLKAKVEALATEMLSRLKKYDFDGLGVALPQDYKLIDKEVVVAFLNTLTTQVGKGTELLFVVETPLVEAKEAIDKANWIVFNQNGVPSLSLFNKEAAEWSSVRYLPSFSFSDKDLAAGYADASEFSPFGPIPRDEAVLTWKATNKGGIAVYDTQQDYFNFDGNTSYAKLRRIIAGAARIK